MCFLFYFCFLSSLLILTFSLDCSSFQKIGDPLLFSNFNLSLQFYGKSTRFYSTSYENIFSFSLLTYNQSYFYDDSVIHSRILAPNLILDIPFFHPTDSCPHLYLSRFNLTHPLSDAKFQIRISWLTGSNLDAILPLKRDKASRFLNHSQYLDEIVYDSPISPLPSNLSPSLPSSYSKPLCSSLGSIHAQSGRWVRVEEGQDCPKGVCEGSSEAISLLSDKFGFNHRFVWSPDQCVYRVYTGREIGQCFREKGVRQLAFTGDSLLREHFQNLLSLLIPDQVHLKKLKSVGRVWDLPLPSPSPSPSLPPHLINLSYFQQPNEWRGWGEEEGEGGRRGADVHLWGLPLLKYMVMEGKEEWLRAQTRQMFRATFNRLASPRPDALKGRSRIHYLLHPSIQREDPRIDREALRATPLSSVNSFACMTPHRMRAASEEVEGKLKEMILPLSSSLPPSAPQWGWIDPRPLSSSRWEASWDGLHYSLLLSTEQMKRGEEKRVEEKGGQGRRGIEGYCSGSTTLVKGGGSYMCPSSSPSSSPLSLQTYLGINKCLNSSKGGEGEGEGEGEIGGGQRMYWCRGIVNREKEYQLFEGGVSRMLTMVWLNTICN